MLPGCATQALVAMSLAKPISAVKDSKILWEPGGIEPDASECIPARSDETLVSCLLISTVLTLENGAGEAMRAWASGGHPKACPPSYATSGGVPGVALYE